MDKKARKTITEIGPVLFGKITVNTIANAQDVSQRLEMPERARVFTNHIISGAVIKPKLSPSKVNLLPDIAINELISCVVGLLHIEEYYAAAEEDDLHLKIYSAFRNYEAELFSGFLNNIKPLLMPLDFPILNIAGSAPVLMAKHCEKFRSIRERFESLNTKWRGMATMFSSILISAENLNFAGILKDFAIQFKPQKETADAFRAAGWPIAPSMPEELIERVVEKHKQGNARYISRTIMGYYQRDQKANLKAMVEGWSTNPFFSPRMRIIENALWAHCKGIYTLSYPAILPQIEGIMRSYVHKNNLIDGNKNPKLHIVYEAVADNYDLSNWLIAAILLYELQNNIYSFNGFEEELKKSDTSRSITRHTVTHGIACNYDTEKHSLKAFLLLDAISALPVQI
jgi:hypothetical protein